ncbi:MAG TPA: TonB-dependent receptor, partial [Salinivirgaceae bacterium]|nr:TonB-dependent receptor [Salinivirgaceae bacterium]
VRRSYLQFLFAALGLPFLPTYNDAQFKTRVRINPKNEVILIGLGAYDVNRLNLDANETEEQRYTLKYLPENTQWNYTLGTVFKHYTDIGYNSLIISRNHLNNISRKYRDNIEVPENLTLDYQSSEIETKMRYEEIKRIDDWKFLYGAGLEYNQYTNETYNKIFINNQSRDLFYNSSFDFVSYSIFGQITRSQIAGRLLLSGGIRFDGNTYSNQMVNPINQFSPRISTSYNLTPEWALNVSIGRFFQRPPYTTMGFRDFNGDLINKTNGLRYIESDQMVLGIENKPNPDSRITIEGFYKWYRRYPFSVADSVALSSKSADFDVFGAEAVTSDGIGRAYGIEFLVRHTNLWKSNIISSLTFVRSEFKNLRGEFIPSAWDNKIIFNLTATRELPRNWDIGFKWRFLGGQPYTPIDFDRSSLRIAYDILGKPYLDYSKFNSERLKPFHQLDVRIDKQYFFKKYSLMFYLDIQNVYAFKSQSPDRYINEDQNGNVVIANPNAPIEEQRYVLRKIPVEGTGTVLPTVGIMLEF